MSDPFFNQTDVLNRLRELERLSHDPKNLQDFINRIDAKIEKLESDIRSLRGLVCSIRPLK